MTQIKRKYLTIAIPTYNRSNYLKNSLDSLCKIKNDEIEIVVRDNGSTNYDFRTFIEPYEKEYGIIAYRNEKNLGMDANFTLLFQECNTNWLLILGDDDIIDPNCIDDILKILKDNEDSIFIKFNSSFEGKVYGIKGFAKAMSPKPAFLESFFISEGFHNIKLGKDDILLNYKYLSMKFAHILRVMEQLKNNPNNSCYFTSKPILIDHGEDISWKHDELIIPYLIMYDLFHKERSIFKGNIFQTIGCTLFYYIKDSDYSFNEKLYFIKQIFYKYGILNTLRYCHRSIIKNLFLR